MHSKLRYLPTFVRPMIIVMHVCMIYFQHVSHGGDARDECEQIDRVGRFRHRSRSKVGHDVLYESEVSQRTFATKRNLVCILSLCLIA